MSESVNLTKTPIIHSSNNPLLHPSMAPTPKESNVGRKNQRKIKYDAEGIEGKYCFIKKWLWQYHPFGTAIWKSSKQKLKPVYCFRFFWGAGKPLKRFGVEKSLSLQSPRINPWVNGNLTFCRTPKIVKNVDHPIIHLSNNPSFVSSEGMSLLEL